MAKILINAIIFHFIIGLSPISTTSQVQTCTTPACMSTASKLLKNMDSSVDPCDNFYQFACGNFVKTTKIPDDKSEVSNFYTTQDIIFKQLKNILEQQPFRNESKPLNLARKFYQSCNNVDLKETNGLSEIKKILQEFGGWPLTENWQGSYEWTEMLYRFRKIGMVTDQLMSVNVETDLRHSSRKVITISEPRKEYHISLFLLGKFHTIFLYYQYLVDIAVLFGTDKKTANLEMSKIVEFEMKLALITKFSNNRHNLSENFNLATIQQLQEQIPSIPWHSYLTNILEMPISNEEIIFVPNSLYFSKLENLISKTPRWVLANYITWKAVYSLITSLPGSFRQSYFEYKAQLYSGEVAMQPRWRECVEILSKNLPVAVGALYKSKYGNPYNISEILNNIYGKFRNILLNNEWMDIQTKQKALEKFDLIRIEIGFPDELLQPEKMNKFFQKLEIEPSFLKSLLNVNKFQTDFSYGFLRRSTKDNLADRVRVLMDFGFYRPYDNTIFLPIGILQETFFDPNLPQYANYARLGFFIGHEITHAFDDIGSQYDKNGNLANWWSQDSRQKFIDKAQCIIEEFSKFIVPKINITINGRILQGENLADLSGFQVAYMAYDEFVNNNGLELGLPGLNLNSRQLFWLVAANGWCVKLRNEKLLYRVVTDVHAIDNYRVMVPFSHNPYFSRDFYCPVNSRMNPQPKCGVW